MKLICAFLALAMTAKGAASDPGKAALDFLEKVRNGDVDLAPGADTALSPQTADSKKREIAKRLERIARDLGSDPLEVGAVKTDENFAAVLVRKMGGFDPNRLQVFPVALVKRDKQWAVAPVPASFENAGAGYAISLKKRLELLENWMLREQVVDLQKLRAQSAERMRQTIRASLPPTEFRSLGAKQVAQRFLTACENRDLPTTLGLLGGISDDLPEDWTLRLKSTNSALAAESPENRSWRLMMAPEVMRVMVHHEEDPQEGLFTVAFLDPSSKETRTALPTIEVIHFELAKNEEGLWRVDPPSSFLQGENEGNGDDEGDEEFDGDLIDAFPAQWLGLHPSTPQATAELLREAMASALRNDSPIPLMNLVRTDANPDAAIKAFSLAAKLWWTLRNPAVVRCAVPVAWNRDEQFAVSRYQFFSARDPDRLDLRTLYFSKTPSGWLWSPDPDKSGLDQIKQLETTAMEAPSDTWQQELLADSIEVGDISALPAPKESDARQVVESWFVATRAGDVKSALQLTARLSDPQGPSTILRNLGHEISGARRSRAITRVASVQMGRMLTAVAVEFKQSGNTSFPVYPVIQTPKGPRLLIEIDLFASRGQNFLNKLALERVAKLGSQAAADELREQFAGIEAELQPSEID